MNGDYIRELNAEINRLKAEVSELKERLKPDDLDWSKAEKHLAQVIANYDSIRFGPSTDARFVMKHVIKLIKVRFDAGERTPALHKEILNLV